MNEERGERRRKGRGREGEEERRTSRHKPKLGLELEYSRMESTAED